MNNGNLVSRTGMRFGQVVAAATVTVALLGASCGADGAITEVAGPGAVINTSYVNLPVDSAQVAEARAAQAAGVSAVLERTQLEQARAAQASGIAAALERAHSESSRAAQVAGIAAALGAGR